MPAPGPNVADAPAAPAGRALHAAGLAAETGARVYRSEDGPTPSFMLVERDAPAEGSWMIRRSTGPTATGPWQPSVEQHWVLTGEGHAAIADEINHDEKVELVYEPPLVMLPAALEPASTEAPAIPFEQTVRMRVHPLGNRRAVKAAGSARQVTAHLGGATRASPTGDRPSQHVLITFSAALMPAEVTNLTHQWFTPETELLAEEREERTRVLGIQTRHNRESWVLHALPD